jgi:hypothetical protein
MSGILKRLHVAIERESAQFCLKQIELSLCSLHPNIFYQEYIQVICHMTSTRLSTFLYDYLFILERSIHIDVVKRNDSLQVDSFGR